MSVILLEKDSIISDEVNMPYAKQKAIEIIVDTAITNFATGLISRYSSEVDDVTGVINMKKNNCFIAELGEEFMFYSAFVRSFDSSFGNVLENIGNGIAKLSYDVKGTIDSFLLPEQTQRIANILDNYVARVTKPNIEHYSTFSTIYPRDITSYKRSHKTDNYFYNPTKNEHYLIELKASGDLDNKKARSEKSALLEEYFLLKNLLKNDPTAKVFIFFGTAYNKFGEGVEWKQERVRQFFADDELLIGKDYWNFVCDSPAGFEIIFNQYKKSANKIRFALNEIKGMYFK